jgi:hypothetical protein
MYPLEASITFFCQNIIWDGNGHYGIIKLLSVIFYNDTPRYKCGFQDAVVKFAPMDVSNIYMSSLKHGTNCRKRDLHRQTYFDRYNFEDSHHI